MKYDLVRASLGPCKNSWDIELLGLHGRDIGIRYSALKMRDYSKIQDEIRRQYYFETL